MNLIERCKIIEKLFNRMDGEQASNWQKEEVSNFRNLYPELNSDLDFCFEILAGMHKMGITAHYTNGRGAFNIEELVINSTIKDFYSISKQNFDEQGRTQLNIITYCKFLNQLGIDTFFVPLINREYRLGFSNKDAMITDKTPMLAKKWDEECSRFIGKRIYVQEKYDGNRCISWKENGEWHFQSRRGKPLNVNFDMEGFAGNTKLVFDGEVMTKRGDFNKASGIISSIDKDKDQLIYVIYDIIDPNYNYTNRQILLENFKDTEKVKVAPTLLSGVYIGNQPINRQEEVNDEMIYNLLLDMVENGGEGLIVRIGGGLYENKRSLNLLKYKLVQSMDMKCVDWIAGTGKYEGMIGSLKAELITDKGDHIVAYVGSGLSDEDRCKDPEYFLGKILEVQYFEKSKNQGAGDNEWSLRFPRLKGVRNDKSTTSEY